MAPLDKKQCMKMGHVCACFNLRRTARRVSQAYDRALKPTGVKITQMSLLVAAHNLDRIALSKLARIMGMDRTTLSRNLKLLEKKGLIELISGDDRREVRAGLTPEGEKVLEQAIPLWEEAQRRINEAMGEDKWESMLGDLRTLSSLFK